MSDVKDVKDVKDFKDVKVVAQLYCQKAKVNTTCERISNRTFILVVKSNQHWIYYYDGFKFLKAFGPLSSVEIEFNYHTQSIDTSTLIINHMKKTSETKGSSINHQNDQVSYKIILRSNLDFMCLYLKYDDYKKDPLQLQKENVKDFITKLVTTMPY